MAAVLIPVLVDDPLQMAWLDTNDLGNAERLARLTRRRLLWVNGIGWVAYDGRRWSERDGERMAAQFAHDVARHVDAEAAALDAIANDPPALKDAFGWDVPVEIAQERVIALRKHAVKSGNASATAGMLVQARAILSADRESFDVDPLALNLANCTLRFVKDGEGGWSVRDDPHDPEDRLMQIAAFHYDATARCVGWRERLELVQPDRDQRRLLQMIYGYALTGLTSEQKWFIYQGRGGDGKSLTNAVITKLMGDYYRHAGIETFLEGAKKSGSDHSSDLARLAGDVRLVTCDEPTKNSTWNGSRLKQVTGSTVTARPLREKEIEFEPRWKLIVEVNPLPAVPSDDDGFWRRCWALPWSYQFDKGGVASEPFELLRDRFIHEEGSGILNWMIAGALRWLATRRLPPSQAATAFALAYRQSASPIGEWYMECCDLSDRAAETASGALYASFKEWGERAALEKIPTQTAFGRWLRDKQHLERKDRRGNRLRVGIKLRGDFDSSGLGTAAASDPAYLDAGVGGRAAAWPSSHDADDADDMP